MIREQLLKYGYPSKKAFTPNLQRTNCAFGLILEVTADGNVHTCYTISEKVGNVKNDNLEDIIKKMDVYNEITNVDNLEECKACDLKYICYGGCKALHKLRNGSYTKVACNDSFKNRFYTSLINNESQLSYMPSG